MEPQLMLPQPKHAGGRPSKLTTLVLQKLIAAFQRGDTDQEACKYARITPAIYYLWRKNDEEFFDEIESAKTFWEDIAGDVITELLTEKRVPAKVRFDAAKFTLENRRPDRYGAKAIALQQQNNYTFISNEQLPSLTKELTKRSGIQDIDPTELLEALENKPDLDNGAEEESPPQVYPDEVSSNDPDESNMPQP